MTVTVHLFAAARDLTGRESLSVELGHGATVANLRTALIAKCPPLTPLLARSFIAVNHNYASDETVLSEGDEIAVIPPVSGG